MPFAPRILSNEALQDLGIGAKETIAAIQDTLRKKADGSFITTPKSVIQPGDGRYTMTTLSSGAVTVVKCVSVCPENPTRDLPSIMGAIMVLDAETGACLAVMDAEWITGIRTAGLSAVAAKEMADPASETISFVGCGVQARTHLELFAQLFPLRRIRAYGRGQANIDRLCGMAREMGLEAEHAQSPEAALDDADIVVTSITLTYTGAPFLDARRLKPTAFAAITDIAKPWLPESLDMFKMVVVDDLEQELSMPSPMVPAEQISGDLMTLVDGKVAMQDGPRALMFRGIAAGDYALAAKVWETVERSSH